MIIVPSIHHTGTKLVFNDILKDVPEVNQQEYMETIGKIRIHIDEPFLDDIHYWCAKFPSIVPLRHPRTLAKGWKVRKKRLEVLEQQLEWLKNDVDPYKPFYLPIEQKDRDTWLRKINEALDESFITDWPIVGSCEQTTDLDEVEECRVQSWMKDGFFEQFGYRS